MRDAFEHASKLAPMLLEAQLLFRETDRAVHRLRETVGTPAPLELDVPGHLPAVRDLVRANKLAEAARALAHDETDAAAQRLRGELLAFMGRAGDALFAFELALAHIDSPAAQLGKARVLLELARADEALAIFERSDATEALEGKARALQQLGRTAEAEAAFATAILRADHGAELRVRATRG